MRATYTRTLLSCAVVLVGCSAQSSNTSFDDSAIVGTGASQVQLRYAKADVASVSPDGLTGGWAGAIEVQNLAFQKEVTVVWRQPTSGGMWGPWQETKASYSSDVGDGHELWSFRDVGAGGLATGSNPTQLAIRYRVQGREYWDHGLDSPYEGTIQSPSTVPAAVDCPLGPSIEVAVVGASVRPWASGGGTGASLLVDMVVRNDAPEKQVTVTYSLDDWRTVLKAPASYGTGNGRPGSGETWRASIPFDTGSGTIAFSVTKTGGTESRDDNFGHEFECARSGTDWTCTGTPIP